MTLLEAPVFVPTPTTRICVWCHEDYNGTCGPKCPTCNGTSTKDIVPGTPEWDEFTPPSATTFTVPADSGFLPLRNKLDILADIA